MKAQILILFFLISVLSSCDRKDGGNYPYKTWTMEIENASTHILRIKLYSFHQPGLNVDTTLTVNQKYALTNGNEDPLGVGPDLISIGAFDSAVVIFADNKKLIYVYNRTLSIMNDSANNFLIKDNYHSKGITGNREVFSYSFDDSDYLRAEK